MITTLIIITLLIALLAIPLTLRFRISRYESTEGRFKLHWLFGLINLKLSTPQQQETKKPSYAHEKRKKASSKLDFRRALQQKAFRDRLIKFVTDLWHAIKKEELSLYLRLGLGDPATTGQLWAIIGPLSGILFTAEECEIEIVPDFLQSIFEFQCDGTIRIIPLQLIALTLGLIFSPTMWRGIISAGDKRRGFNGDIVR